MRSNINIGGKGNCGPPANISPRPQASKSSNSKLEGRFCIPTWSSPQRTRSHADAFPNIRYGSGKAALFPDRTGPSERPVVTLDRDVGYCEALATSANERYN